MSFEILCYPNHLIKWVFFFLLLSSLKDGDKKKKKLKKYNLHDLTRVGYTNVVNVA